MPKELLGTTIGKLRNKLHRLMKQRYAAEANIKLTVEEFILLTMIRAKTDQILQNIAIATGKNKSVVMRMIDSLEKKGLVKRTVNPEDRRENLLSTTDMGEQVVAEYHKIEKKLSYELLKGIPDEKVEVFFEVVEEISRRTNSL
ncbi:MarR family winged helix-turn-helix transcriptional regulator [Xylanibacter rarus]|jgi:MarR family transcriptional regulator for hemolysin|uniref:MarR family winged helix-turn-helix transcriptional regulator n=1 Tax=Xylanibacter rarus TaxID=1676614 RepID=UPI0025CF95B3|nr:MarR family winged helix-turn-helix transcriptional regulator [uncultured Prevotella sp.]HJH75478.1 MarR family winged helix-turn-helix transcriptional regulator [Prevotellaceae bacterium]